MKLPIVPIDQMLDNSTDIAAGKAAGTYTVKIGAPDPLADINAGSLYEAVPMILEMRYRLQ
ncbi:hypothetical protein O9H85_37205 [Paenibacillus filicis]|uniref:Uncharacterized protein n=1 Tax=Paenibacillus gyeongsangnamensis TaxID=3388067 RepID=A0ABT4QLT6_9BACL|nr:hypothetical protein [Paenibacillus filicis]MCZ8517826.1 hypothetical protein [Paenibacillus filicis]